jgi:hypothetical protein
MPSVLNTRQCSPSRQAMEAAASAAIFTFMFLNWQLGPLAVSDEPAVARRQRGHVTHGVAELRDLDHLLLAQAQDLHRVPGAEAEAVVRSHGHHLHGPIQPALQQIVELSHCHRRISFPIVA